MTVNEAQKTLTGRVAIVTGASRGIGSGIARRLGSAGATVVVTARSLEQSKDGLSGTLQETASLIERAGGKAIAIACDLESAESRAQLISQTISGAGRIDILVNNAGRAIHEKLDTFTPDKALAQVQQYLLAPFDLTRLVLPYMRNQGGGWIVNLGSASATAEDPPYNDYSTHGGASLYTALKAAVHRLTPSHAAELYADNISVNTVAPVGAVMTPGLDALGTMKPGMEGYLEPVDHIAEATLALVEPEPRSLTGQLAFSFRYLDQIGRSTWSLDGKTILSPRSLAG
jgi:NAD(P)-dependent dehydrogenase (short-subunit alcohol dehydrogenase family)